MNICTRMEEEVKVPTKTTEERFRIVLSEDETHAIFDVIGELQGPIPCTVREYMKPLWKGMSYWGIPLRTHAEDATRGPRVMDWKP